MLEKIVPADFSGTLQSDAYGAYPAFARRHGRPLTLAACWAHARREFVEASLTGEGKADALLIVRLIGRLYAIEERLRVKRASAKLRALTRQVESRPIVERISAILRHWQRRGRRLPRSQMGKAIDYTLGVWRGLCVFLEDGRVEIDNNPVEKAIRPTAVGKRNWLCVSRKEVTDVKRRTAA